MSGRLSKSRVLAWLQCPKRLWLQVHRPELAVHTPGAEQRLAAGHRVTQTARALLPGGVLIGPDDNLAQALALTRALLRESPTVPLFEATFEHQGVLVRADLLVPHGSGYRAVEVKSAASLKDYYLSDCAVQAWVMEGAGVALERMELAHIDASFVYPGAADYRGLFRHVDVGEPIKPLKAHVPSWVEQAHGTLQGAMPAVEVGAHCHEPFDCPFLGFCAPPDPEFPVTLLPRGGKVAAELLGEGIDDLRDVPADRLTNEVHERVWRATVSDSFELDAQAGETLRTLPYPRYYLDFEAVQFTVPIWPGTSPYSQYPFQWSCHIEDQRGALRHAEFLRADGDPPMRAFAESLVDTLGEAGPIFVYSHFERTRIKALMAAYPEFAPRLAAALDRLVDLLPLARQHYYHRDMKGSWSMKALLRTVAPDLDYASLGEVQDGQMAQLAYLELMNPTTSATRRVALSSSLLQYCKLDTLALVRLAWFFQGQAPGAVGG